METDVFEYIRRGYTVVCASSRLAHRLQYRYAQLQVSEGHSAWVTPDILTWGAWMQRCWDEVRLRENRNLILISNEQQLYIWQQLIHASHGRQLLQVPATARQALNAWNIVHEWEIPLFPEGIYLNEDANAFRAWSGAYGEYCKTNGLIDVFELPALLLGNTSVVSALKPIALVGFDEISPLQTRLLTGLEKAGKEFQVISPDERNESIAAVGKVDTRGEIRAAALWCRRLLESGKPDNIGVVVPDLRSLYAPIEDIFDDVLIPVSVLVDNGPPLRPFSIALGLPLNSYPVIKTALNILDLGDQAMALESLSSVIRSPFMRGGESEMQDRARFDACLRKYGEHQITLKSLDYYAGRYLQRETVPTVLLELCRGYLEVFSGMRGQHPLYEWAGVFTELLNRFGWPGDRTLDSTEYQIVTEWRRLMEKLAALDPSFRSIDYREALTQLRQLAVGAGFHAETVETPVQIMGMAGAAGMEFDHLWVMGLDEESWPYQADPNPFIPIQLQRDAGIPGATAELALMQATRDRDRLVRSAREIVLSHPENDRDRPLRPSPLIRQYLTPFSGPTDDGRDYGAILFASRRMVDSIDDMAPVIPAGEAVSGGTALFSDQAACPFRACARHRLYAEGLESRDIGLDARDRGTIMHEVLRLLWGKLMDHAVLLAASGSELDKLINKSVNGALSSYRKRYPVTFTEKFTRLEAARIGAVMHDWLELEKQRRPFRVTAREYRHRVSLGEIEVRTRIDRIDRLEDGRDVIIDYKTGDPKTTAWLGERPDEPQLPLYAISSEGDIAAVVFARLRRGLSCFIGLAQEQGLLPGVGTVEKVKGGAAAIPDWSTLFDNWRTALTQLAQNFRQGDARVDPKGPDTCRWCDLHSMCRIYERGTGYGERGTVND